MSDIKWSKKEIVSKDWKVWRDNKLIIEPHNEIDVYIYSWSIFKLIKELYGENRNYYFLTMRWDSTKEKSYETYLCDESGHRARMFNNISNATKHLEYILENGLMSRDRWVNPNVERISNVLT
jgi:hypothetical protein